jgi:hypothetical protein
MINSGVEILQAAKRPRTRSVTFRLRSSDRWSSAPSSTSWSRSARWEHCRRRSSRRARHRCRRRSKRARDCPGRRHSRRLAPWWRSPACCSSSCTAKPGSSSRWPGTGWCRNRGRINPRTGTPVKLTIGFGIFAALVAALVPLGAIVEMVNIGTLFAFVAAVQGASSLHLVPDRHPPLHLPDLGPAVGDLRPVRRMACRRDRDLPAVRVLALPAAAPLPRRPRPARHRARRPSDPRNTNPEAR